MKINELIYQTPEMTEEKLLEIMSSHLSWLKRDFVKRIEELHKGKSLQEALLMEYDNIQDKKSYLTKSQRDVVIGFVGVAMIEMTKGNGTSGE
jgi:NADH:ubiquinone oxidoreductase subunit E